MTRRDVGWAALGLLALAGWALVWAGAWALGAVLCARWLC